MKIAAHSAVEIGQRVRFTSRAADDLGGASSSYRDMRGTVTGLPERHMALVLWDGDDEARRVVRHYLEPVFGAEIRVVILDDIVTKEVDPEAAREWAASVPRCQIHGRELVCPSCMAQKGGSVSSEAKREAARAREAAKRRKRRPRSKEKP